MAQPNRTKNALLGFLCWGAMSGYDLGQIIEGSISNFWSESHGRIYPILAQLVKEGLATRRETVSDGGRLRHVYAITEKGRAHFEAWLGQPVVPRPARNELLLKLFFGARTEPGTSLAMLAETRVRLEGQLEHYAEIRRRLESVPKPPRDLRYWLVTLRYGELEARAHLEWCDEVLPVLRDAPDSGEGEST